MREHPVEASTLFMDGTCKVAPLRPQGLRQLFSIHVLYMNVTWSDLKSAAKQNAAATKKSLEGTGGGSPKSDDEAEDSMNNRIANIIGESVVFGIPDVDEFGVQRPNNDQRQDSDAHEKDADQPEAVCPGSWSELSNDASKDLGVTLLPSLNPELHVRSICSRANKMLGFVSRFSKGLSDTALKTLYCALVRQILEYGSPVWNPHQKFLIDELETIQRRFIRMVGVRNGFLYRQVPIVEVSRALGLQTLADRRFSADVVLLSKILNGKIDCPDMLSLILFRTPSATRSRDLFARQQHRTNYAANDTMYRLQRSGNSIADVVDFFVDSIPVLKRRIAALHELSV